MGGTVCEVSRAGTAIPKLGWCSCNEVFRTADSERVTSWSKCSCTQSTPSLFFLRWLLLLGQSGLCINLLCLNLPYGPSVSGAVHLLLSVSLKPMVSWWLMELLPSEDPAPHMHSYKLTSPYGVSLPYRQTLVLFSFSSKYFCKRKRFRNYLFFSGTFKVVWEQNMSV